MTPENIHTITQAVSWNSEGQGDFWDWNSKGKGVNTVWNSEGERWQKLHIRSLISKLFFFVSKYELTMEAGYSSISQALALMQIKEWMVSSNLMNKTFNMVGCGRWHIMNFCLSLVFNMIYCTENMKLKKKGLLVVSNLQYDKS